MNLTQPKLFEIVWKLSNKKSFISRLPLFQYYHSKFHYNIFSHVLSKSRTKYPFFELYFDNIQIITPREHFIIDHGNEDLRISYSKEVKEKYNNQYKVEWNKWDEKEIELIELYQELFPEKKEGIIWKYDSQEIDEVIMELNKEFIN